MSDPTHEILEKIGRLTGLMEGVHGDIADIKQNMASEADKTAASRKEMYRSIEETRAVAVRAAAAADGARKAADAADGKIEREVMPVIDEVRRWKFAGMTWLAIAGVAGASVVAFLIWAWDVIRAKLGL
ncbi:DUF1515 family protein [Breoghania sp. JC706]|uniref:DUF1515 family protein n=1 Tax=Breoghania sp. JC706 TaxID=3117732 RepID=UPI003008421E